MSRETRRHILTISVEDYFHVGAFAGRVLPKHWNRLQPRLEETIGATLELLAGADVKATFFVLGCIAEERPEIVRRIVAEGHEVASSGHWPRGVAETVPDEFRQDLLRSKSALEAAGSNPIRGYRAARNWLRPQDLWVLNILAEEGFDYDSSVNPRLRSYAAAPALFEARRHRLAASHLYMWEFPISTVSIGGLRVPISGGNYIRQLPHSLLRRATAHWHKRKTVPLVFYLMPWELDREQPRIRSISRLTRLRHYRNLGKARWVLEYYFSRYRFQSIGDFLGIDFRRAPRARSVDTSSLAVNLTRLSEESSRMPITIVVPLYNEAENISYLGRTLAALRDQLQQRYEVSLVLVDDGSQDETWRLLEREYKGAPAVRLLRQPENRGVAAAIEAGIRSAGTELVCSIDCDCSYDPTELTAMIPLIEEGEIVTASPYHPDGHVFNVPGWRLFLSHTLSRLYNVLLQGTTHTYTSCFRVYRKSWVEGLGQRSGDFVGIAEMLIQTKLTGGRVVEYPTTLEARLLGASKMKTMRSISQHLKLLAKLVLRRGDLVAPRLEGSEDRTTGVGPEEDGP